MVGVLGTFFSVCRSASKECAAAERKQSSDPISFFFMSSLTALLPIQENGTFVGCWPTEGMGKRKMHCDSPGQGYTRAPLENTHWVPNRKDLSFDTHVLSKARTIEQKKEDQRALLNSQIGSSAYGDRLRETLSVYSRRCSIGRSFLDLAFWLTE